MSNNSQSSQSSQKLVRFDWAMKNILRNKANFDILEGFLTCLLNEKITIENLLESESNKDRPDGKINRVDLKCKDSTGRQIIVEIQSERQIDYFERMTWSTSKAVVESLEEGDEYVNIAKIVSVSILYHNLYYPELNKDYIYEGSTNIIGRHTKDKLVMNKARPGRPVTSEDVFPTHYVICVKNFNEKIHDAIDEWVYMFKKERVEADFDAPGIDKAAKKLGYLQMSDEERARYDSYIEAARYEFSVTETSRLEGKAEGIAEGITIGERAKAVETARRFLSMGLSIQQVAEGTDLSEEEVENIVKIGDVVYN